LCIEIVLIKLEKTGTEMGEEMEFNRETKRKYGFSTFIA
jgi:hypothetical protein